MNNQLSLSIEAKQARALYLCVAGFLALATVLIGFSLTAAERNAQQLVSKSPLIVHNEIINSSYALAAALVLGSLVILIENHAKRSPPDEKPRRQATLQTLLVYAIVFCIPGAFAMNFLVDASWHQKYERAGYHRCDNSMFLLSKSFTSSAWVRQPEWCLDEGVQNILLKHHNLHGYDEATRFLKERNFE